jgi:hypothetical protein
MIGVGNGVGGGHVIAVLTDGTRTLIKWTCVWLCPSMAMRTRAPERRESEKCAMSERSGFKCSVHVSSVSMTMYDDSKWKDTYNMISRPRL